MSLARGHKLLYYEIKGTLGTGSMGEVYRAVDTRLAREVAIKVLPEEFIGDEERLMRFEREARSLASLNHPNVAQIFGVDQVGDLCFLVLELVPGETLEERLKRGALPLDEALDVASQIAEGLEAAHEAGVIHRDLKPANVRITPRGRVKLLDFGLAKPAQPETETLVGGPVLHTRVGHVLGTPYYMAPEQAGGKEIDRRVDVWSFGCVLFKCLAGERPFGGRSQAEVLAAALHGEPKWSALPPSTPARVHELLHRCLERDPRRRLRDIGDARVELELASAGEELATAGSARSLPWRALAIGLALALPVAAFSGYWLGGDRPTIAAATPAPRFALSVAEPAGDAIEITTSAGRAVALRLEGERLSDPAWSPSGHLLFRRESERPGIWALPFSLAALEATGAPFPVADGGSRPCVSADGALVYVSASGELTAIERWTESSPAASPIAAAQ